MSYKLHTTMIFGGLFLIFLGLLINNMWLSIVGALSKMIADSYEFEELLTVKQLFTYKKQSL